MAGTVKGSIMAKEHYVEAVVRTNAPILTTGPEATIETAAVIMRDNNVGCLVVINDRGDMLGIISERDIMTKVMARGMDPISALVGDVMVRKVVSCGLNTPLTEAQAIMADNGIRHLPIVWGGHPIGMISTRDIMAHQLSTVQAIVKRQMRVIDEVERTNPGITALCKDGDGRILIDAPG